MPVPDTIFTQQTQEESTTNNNNWIFQLLRLWQDKYKHELPYTYIWHADGWTWKPSQMLPVFLDYLRFLENEFPFLVLLCLLIGTFILPTQHLMAVAAGNISDRVQTGHELSVFFWPDCNVHCMWKQKRSTISTLWFNKIDSWIMFLTIYSSYSNPEDYRLHTQ